MDEQPTRQTILVVDDFAENIMVLDAILQDEYDVRVATSGAQALNMAAAKAPDLILLDVMMPGMDGFEVATQLKADCATHKIPIIFVTAMGEVQDEARGLALGAVDYLTKPVSPPIVMARVKTHLALYDQNRVLEQKVTERTRELEVSQAEVVMNMQRVAMAQTEMLQRLSQAAEFRDDDTGQHTVRVGELSHLLAARLGMTQARCDLILRAAPLHDVGKIGIPDEILLKPARLTPEEFAVMKNHATIGAAILNDGKSALVRMAEIIALTHHERWDGSGYPRGLKGDAIPSEGQIVGIVDVFDALTHVRPYKAAWTVDQALAEIDRLRDTQFSARMVDALLLLHQEGLI